MGKLNKVLLIGNLGEDVKMHFFDDGGCIGRVSLATTERYKKKGSDEYIENTEWHSLVFNGKRAEIAAKYMKKGSKVYIEGRLKYRSWEDSEGQKKYSTEIRVNEFEFLEKVESSESSSRPPQAPPEESQGDDLPF